jgi:hypothetical protein
VLIAEESCTVPGSDVQGILINKPSRDWGAGGDIIHVSRHSKVIFINTHMNMVQIP